MTALMMTILEENKELFAVSTEQSIVINTHKKTKKKYITLFITQFTIAKWLKLQCLGRLFKLEVYIASFSGCNQKLLTAEAEAMNR